MITRFDLCFEKKLIFSEYDNSSFYTASSCMMYLPNGKYIPTMYYYKVKRVIEGNYSKKDKELIKFVSSSFDLKYLKTLKMERS